VGEILGLTNLFGAPSSCPADLPNESPGPRAVPDREEAFRSDLSIESWRDRRNQQSSSPLSFLEFVEQRFIPEFVSIKRSSGRTHYRAILKHVLPPKEVTRVFGVTPRQGKDKLEAIRTWPYMDALRLSEVTHEIVQRLISAALIHGYSIQTATHIRNVISAIFSHAIRTGFYLGQNPAALVKLPAMRRRQLHTLSFQQVKELLQAMCYPEREIALFAMLTNMNVAEICGLQWKYLNLSSNICKVEHELVLPRTIAIRKQSYRGELSSVIASRRRLVRIPPLLCLALEQVRSRMEFTKPQDFVLISRNGTPIHPENIAARRLKRLGRSFQMPWLSWSVFHRTRLDSEVGLVSNLHEQFENDREFRQAIFSMPCTGAEK
jgi:site-specific recombinase XerD